MLAIWYFSVCLKNIMKSKKAVEPNFLEEQMEHFKIDDNSLAKHFLTKELIQTLGPVKTVDGIGMLEILAPTINLTDKRIGVQIPHIHCLCVFSKFFDPMFNEIHGNFNHRSIHPFQEIGDPHLIIDVHPFGHFIVSTQIHIVRNLEGYNFPAWAKEKELLEIEYFVKRGLKEFKGDLKGQYLKWDQVDANDVLFIEKNDLLAEGVSELLNNGRGIFISDDHSFIVWVNYKHHLKVIVLGKEGYLKSLYCKVKEVIKLLDRRCVFATHERLGFVGADVLTLGTGMTVESFLFLPHLNFKIEEAVSLVQSKGFQLAWASFPKLEEYPNWKWKLANKKHLGVTEFQTVMTFREVMYSLWLIDTSISKDKVSRYRDSTSSAFIRFKNPGSYSELSELDSSSSLFYSDSSSTIMSSSQSGSSERVLTVVKISEHKLAWLDNNRGSKSDHDYKYYILELANRKKKIDKNESSSEEESSNESLNIVGSSDSGSDEEIFNGEGRKIDTRYGFSEGDIAGKEEDEDDLFSSDSDYSINFTPTLEPIQETSENSDSPVNN